MKKINCILIEADCRSTLGGSCIRDLFNTANYLNDKISNLNSIEVLLTENIKDKSKFPSICNFSVLSNFRKQVQNIIENIPDNSKLFVMISGHGYQKIDSSNDELDNKDEYIKTCNETIIDDDLWDIFINKMKKSIEFIGMCDTCHSGSMFDLDYEYKNKKWISASKRNKIKRNAISIGACKDSQLDNCIVGDYLGFGGALTITILENDLLKNLLECNNDELINVYNKLSKKFNFGQNIVIQTNIV